jgi:RiboL-PSP-HEPN
MDMTPVEVLYQEYEEIVNFLRENSQPSMVSDADRYFKKVIALSAASYFEHRIQEVLVEFVSKGTSDNELAINFFKKKAIGAQYHTFFAWGEKGNPNKAGKNANVFFALFGVSFKERVEAEIAKSTSLTQSVQDFLELGHLRNILVHSNFAAYNIDNKTTKEIYEMFKSGLPFLEFVRTKLVTPPA